MVGIEGSCDIGLPAKSTGGSIPDTWTLIRSRNLYVSHRVRDLRCLVSSISLTPTPIHTASIPRPTFPIPISKQTSQLPLTHITSFHTPTSHYIILDVNMSYPHNASSSSLAMTTPSPPTRSGSENRLLDLPNRAGGTRSTMPKTRSPLSPSHYMDIVRVVSFSSLFARFAGILEHH